MAEAKKARKKTKRSVTQLVKISAIRASYLMHPMEPLGKKCERVAKEFGSTPDTIRNYVYRARAKGDFWNDQLVKLAEEAVQREHEIKVLEKHNVSTSVGFKDMVVDLKEFSYLTLRTSKRLVETAIIMLDYYCDQIQHMVDQAGGVGRLDQIQLQQLKLHQAEIKHYHNQIREFLAPTAVAGYLRMIGIEEAAKADLDDIDKEAFTPEKLQETLIKMGAVSTLDNVERTKNLVEKYSGPEIPDIEGRR